MIAKHGLLKSLVLNLTFLLLLAPSAALADENTYPELDTGTAEIGGGYRGLGVDGGGEILLPYRSLESSGLAWFDLFHYYPSWASFVLRGEWAGEDWYRVLGSLQGGNLGFSFSSNRFPANTDHYTLPAFMGPGKTINTTDLDPEELYQTNQNEQTADLRLRLPTYPAHLRLGLRQYRITGTRREIFNDWSCTTRCHIVSKTRDVDLLTNQANIETDAHLGPIDASYSFLWRQTSDEQDNPLWTYAARGGRARETVEHDVYPGITTREHTATLSTSNTGSLTAAAGMTLGRRTNDHVQLSLDYGALNGQVSWRPLRTLSLVANYRRLEKDEDVSAAAVAERLAAGTIAENSSIENRYSATLNYRPVRGVRFQGYYSLKDWDRETAPAWQPDRIRTNTWKVSTDLKPFRGTSVDLYYQHQTTDHPLYITTPTLRTDRYAAVNIQPWTPVLLQVSFLSTRAKNDENGVWTGTREAESLRENRRDLLQSCLTFTFPAPVTFSLVYGMFSDDVEQDLYLGSSDALHANPDTPYSARGDQLALQASWRPAEPLELKAEVSYLEAYGHYRVDAVPYPDIGSYSRFEAQQWRFSLDTAYAFGSGWKLGTLLSYASYDDQIASDNDEIVREIVVSVSKRW